MPAAPEPTTTTCRPITHTIVYDSRMADSDGVVRDVLAALVAEGPEIGLQVAAYLDGKLVIDAWAWLADPVTRRPVVDDSPSVAPDRSAQSGARRRQRAAVVAQGREAKGSRWGFHLSAVARAKGQELPGGATRLAG
jgi:hypothetical protein